MSGLCGRSCSKCIFNKKYCDGCSLCEASICGNRCRECNCLCPKRPEAISYLNSIGGLDLVGGPNNNIDIPSHIPIIPDKLRIKLKYEIMPVVGVHAGNMFSRNGEKINASYLEEGYAKALNIDKRCEGILEFYVKDRTLEGFWDNRKNIYKDLKRMNFKAIISPNFSVYEDTPRLDHMYNMKRSSIVYKEMLEEKMQCIPDISWYDSKDIERWIEAINKNNIKTIAFSFQVVDVKLKASNVWKSYILGFRYLCQNISSDVQIIIVGATSYNRVVEICKAAYGRKISVLNQSAYVQSRRGMLSEERIREVDLPLEAMIEKNINYFNRIYKQISLNIDKKDKVIAEI